MNEYSHLSTSEVIEKFSEAIQNFNKLYVELYPNRVSRKEIQNNDTK